MLTFASPEHTLDTPGGRTTKKTLKNDTTCDKPHMPGGNGTGVQKRERSIERAGLEENTENMMAKPVRTSVTATNPTVRKSHDRHLTGMAPNPLMLGGC